jgi:methylthioribose-1-phosphate isomerase
MGSGQPAEGSSLPEGDAPEPLAPEPVTPSQRPPDEHDPERRAFFRELGRQAITTVGHVAALSDVMGRGTAAAASLLGVELREAPRTAMRPTPSATPRLSRPPASQPAAGPGDDTYRSPYRLEGDTLRLLDQRRIPDALEELTCRRGSDVAYYLRIGACRGGPVMAQAAAYGIALTARERQEQPPAARQAEARRTRNALLAARPSSRLLAWAVGRMAAAEERLGDEADGAKVAASLRAEADAIAGRIQIDLAAITRHLVAELSDGPSEQPVTVLVHGDPGGLWGGLVGPGIAALTRISEAGRAPRVFVTETRPFLDGARLAAWELRQAGLAHQVIPDAAVAWLLEREPVDAVLVGAEWVAANGDVAAVVGSRGVALLAAAAGRPRVMALGMTATIGPDVPDGSSIPTEMRPAREMTAFQHGTSVSTAVLNPATDVVPAAALDAIVTELGSIAPVTAEAVSEAGSRAAASATDAVGAEADAGDPSAPARAMSSAQATPATEATAT